MKKRKHYSISFKNPLTWLMMLSLVGSAVTRILFGMEGVGLWSQIVLPITAALLFALIALISGKDRFYKSAKAVWFMAIYFCFRFESYQFVHYDTMITALYGITMLFMAISYTQIIGGKSHPIWLLPIIAFPGAAVWYLDRGHPMYALPDLLMVLGVILAILSLKRSTDGLYHPTWGDRVDGRRIRSQSPMEQISPYFMVHRNESCNLIHMPVEISAVERYIRQKRKAGLTNFGLTHVLLACYCRAIAAYPGVNRFLSGQKVYTHGEDIIFCMTVKKEMSTDAPDSVIKVHLSPRDTAEDVYHKVLKEVESVKKSADESELDSATFLFSMIPGLVLKFAIWLLKLLDYFGCMPRFLLELSPFHASVYFTSMGSLGIPPIFHHLYDFGNIPVFVAFGAKRKENHVLEDGTIVERKFVDLNITTDERIVDGFYYAAFVKHYTRLLRRPEQFDEPPVQVEPDID